MQRQSDARGQSPGSTAHDGKTRLSAGASIIGDLSVPGTAEILGQVEGKVTAGRIVIEATGSVTGALDAPNIAVHGRFDGTISGDEVRLHAGATVSGDITYNALSIESGAAVKGKFSRKPNPTQPAPSVTPVDNTGNTAPSPE